MSMTPETLNWLLTGDPAIRWQVMRDLLDEPPAVYETERALVTTSGWGADILARQDANGRWGGGIYSPKWISTTYTMLMLRHLGLPPENPGALQACEHLANGVYTDGGINFWGSFKHSETCVTGMVLALLGYFRFTDDRIQRLAEHLVEQQMPDGGWNCRRHHGATHSSFHTTISVLEGFYEYVKFYPSQTGRIQPVIERAHEFLLNHHLYKSHRTGEVSDPVFTRMVFPPHWHYDFLRGLDYFQSVNAPRDERMQDAIDLLLSKQTENGRWVTNQPWAGKVFFQMEKPGQESRWNTLRGERIMKWWLQAKV